VGENRIHRPPCDPHLLVSHKRPASPGKPSGPSSPEICTDPNVGDRRGRQTPRPRNRGVPFVHGYFQARKGVTAMVVSSLSFGIRQRRRLRWGRGSESAPLWPAGVSAGQQNRVHSFAIDEKRPGAGPRRLRPRASRVFPHSREPGIATGEQLLRAEVREVGRGSSPSTFGKRGAGFAAQLRAPGTGCISPA